MNAIKNCVDLVHSVNSSSSKIMSKKDDQSRSKFSEIMSNKKKAEKKSVSGKVSDTEDSEISNVSKEEVDEEDDILIQDDQYNAENAAVVVNLPIDGQIEKSILGKSSEKIVKVLETDQKNNGILSKSETDIIKDSFLTKSEVLEKGFEDGFKNSFQDIAAETSLKDSIVIDDEKNPVDTKVVTKDKLAETIQDVAWDKTKESRIDTDAGMLKEVRLSDGKDFSIKEVNEPSSIFENASLDNAAEKISKGVSEGLREFEIMMEPANLGRLKLKVAYEGGKAMIHIICTEKNLEIISKNSGNIASLIENRTAEETVVMVENKEPDYLKDDNQKQNGNGRNQQNQNRDDQKSENPKSFLEALRLGMIS